jgi:hypothetical protein
MVYPQRLALRALDRMVGNKRMSRVRLAWVDCWAVEHCGAMDNVGGMFGDDDGDERGYYDGQWECGRHYGFWPAG